LVAEKNSKIREAARKIFVVPVFANQEVVREHSGYYPL
jgi:hypothetical protein